jgi:hypothetical protein
MPFDNYSECDDYAKAHDYRADYQGWPVSDGLVLRWHQPTGFYRLFKFGGIIREYRP